MVGTNRDFDNIAHLIQPDTVGAEIGVWMARSSKRMLEIGIKELHLVDSWSVEPYKVSGEHGGYDKYIERYTKLVGGNSEADFKNYYEKVFRLVQDTVGKDPRTVIHRMSSKDWFDNFDENFEEKLDWIYVDGDHTHKGCLNDLNRALDVVKPGGLILGDDYVWEKKEGTYSGKPEVTLAVDEFCSTHNLEKTRYGNVQFAIKL